MVGIRISFLRYVSFVNEEILYDFVVRLQHERHLYAIALNQWNESHILTSSTPLGKAWQWIMLCISNETRNRSNVQWIIYLFIIFSNKYQQILIKTNKIDFDWCLLSTAQQIQVTAVVVTIVDDWYYINYENPNFNNQLITKLNKEK